MSNDFKTILIGEGFGELRFGMTRAEVKKVVGDPDEIEEIPFSEEEGDSIETWHYDAHDFSLSFEKSMDNRLASIATSSPDAKLNGEFLVDKIKADVMTAMKKMDLGEFEEEVIEEDPDTKVTLVSFFEAGLNLWFENDYLTEIQWGLLEDESEEEEK
jgi:hypothetical protein